MRFELSALEEQPGESEECMKKSEKPFGSSDDMLPEYDFRGGIRGKYLRRYCGANIVVLDPDVAAKFKDSKAVNAALRALLKHGSER